MTFGEKLLNLRKEKGLSQEALADKLNVSRQAVSKWELDESKPDTQNIIEIAELFDCSIDYLLKDKIEEKEIKQEVEVQQEDFEQKEDIFVEEKNEPKNKIDKKEKLSKKLYILSSAYIGVSILGCIVFIIIALCVDYFNVIAAIATMASLFACGIMFFVIGRMVSKEKMPLKKLIIYIVLIGIFVIVFSVLLALGFSNVEPPKRSEVNGQELYGANSKNEQYFSAEYFVSSGEDIELHFPIIAKNEILQVDEVVLFSNVLEIQVKDYKINQIYTYANEESFGYRYDLVVSFDADFKVPNDAIDKVKICVNEDNTIYMFNTDIELTCLNDYKLSVEILEEITNIEGEYEFLLKTNETDIVIDSIGFFGDDYSYGNIQISAIESGSSERNYETLSFPYELKADTKYSIKFNLIDNNNTRYLFKDDAGVFLNVVKGEEKDIWYVNKDNLCSKFIFESIKSSKF